MRTIDNMFGSLCVYSNILYFKKRFSRSEHDRILDNIYYFKFTFNSECYLCIKNNEI